MTAYNLGPLHGRAAPAEPVLARLFALAPRLKVTWRPGDALVPGMWVLYETGGDPLWRDAGIARRAMYLASQDAQGSLTPGIWYAIEAQIAGWHFFGEWPDQVFGSDVFFGQVAQALACVATPALRAQEAEDTWNQAHDDPAFLEGLKAKYPEFAEFVWCFGRDEFARICRGRVLSQVAVDLTPAGATV